MKRRIAKIITGGTLAIMFVGGMVWYSVISSQSNSLASPGGSKDVLTNELEDRSNDGTKSELNGPPKEPLPAETEG